MGTAVDKSHKPQYFKAVIIIASPEKIIKKNKKTIDTC